MRSWRRVSSLMIWNIFSANSSGSLGLKNKAESARTSGMEVVLVETTGQPQLWASMAMMPKPSMNEGRAKSVAAL